MILAAGYVGNLLIIVVLANDHSLRSFTKSLLYVQAFWDIVVLLVPGTRYLIRTSKDVDIRRNNLYVKNIHLYISYLSYDCSTWNLCVLSVERMYLVLWPTSSFIRNLSYKGTLVIGVVLVLFSTIIHTCLYSEDGYYVRINTCLTLASRVIIPFAILISTSVTIIYKLQFHFTKISPNTNSQNQRSPLVVIKMVIVVAIYHVITAAPIDIVLIMMAYNNFKYALWDNIHYVAIYNGAAILMISNASIKFYLYNLSTPHMRRVLMMIFWRIIRKITNK